MRNDFESNYLQHWGIKKGGKKENHKYFERVEKNGKYIYFYTQAEYEAWLHRGNKALDKAKNKMKATAKKPVFKNTRQKLLNALNVGRQGITNSIVKAQKTMTKSNAQAAIDRGNKVISSIINKTSSTVSKQTQNLQKTSKAASANIQQRAKSIANNVSKTLQKAGKDTSKAVQKYVSKGEKAIKSTLAKAGNVQLKATSNRHGKAGSAIVATLLASAAASLLLTAASVALAKYGPKIAKKTKEVVDKIFNKDKKSQNQKNQVKETPPKDFSSDSQSSYKENRAAHSDIPQKKQTTTRDEDMANINPNYHEFSEMDYVKTAQIIAKYQQYMAQGDYEAADKMYEEYLDAYAQYEGYMQNCANCTMTYDMRRRGYDVDAPWNPNGTDIQSIAEWYKDPEVTGMETGKVSKGFSKQECKVLEQSILDKYPEGSYGHFLLYWKDQNGDGNPDGGHDVVWSIENGEVVLRDCQNNKKLDLYEYGKDACAFDMFRADDRELSDKAYAVSTAEKATYYGDADNDDDWDDYWNDFYMTTDNKIKDYQDDAYDYRKAASTKKRK